MNNHQFAEALNMLLTHRLETIQEKQNKIPVTTDVYKQLEVESLRLQELRHTAADW